MGCPNNRCKRMLVLIFVVYLIVLLAVYFCDNNFNYNTVHPFTLRADPANETRVQPLDTESITDLYSTTEDGNLVSAVQDDLTFMAAILLLNDFLLGAGAVVGKRWVIATAFQIGAFKAEQLKVRVGSRSCYSGGQLLQVHQVYPHPMFREFNNDVALLKTAEDMLSSIVLPIPVAISPPEIGTPASFLVWDSDFKVQNNQVDVLPVADCRLFYPDFELTESNICVVMDHVLPFQVTLYGSPLVSNGSLVGHYMGLEANTFKPSLCSSLSPLTGWINLTMTNETNAQRIFPLS